jgi:hypothetical protein
MKHWKIVALALLGAGCGKVAPLTPAPGKALPVKPLMANHTPSAEELLAFTPQARPERVDELLTKNQPRRADRFDLPPPDAGLAPDSPTAASEPAASTTGPDNQNAPR